MGCSNAGKKGDAEMTSRPWISASLSATLLLLSACTTGQRKGAAGGAVMGLVGGATAAAVDGLLWGGSDVGERVVKSSISGATAGAAMGATGAAMSERQQKKGKASSATQATDDRQVEKTRKKIGDINFQAGILWVQCDHAGAIKTAQRAFESASNEKQQLYALTIEAAAALESGQGELADSLYPKIVELDKKRDLDKARADTMEVMLRVQKVRKEQGLPSCK
jgi:hypothetical protein